VLAVEDVPKFFAADAEPLLTLVGAMPAFAAIGHARADQPPDDRLDGTGIFVISMLVSFVLRSVCTARPTTGSRAPGGDVSAAHA
jgi:hypothetical protein